MPNFQVRAPDGKTYNVSGPPGSTADQALAQVKAQLGNQALPADPTPPVTSPAPRIVTLSGDAPDIQTINLNQGQPSPVNSQGVPLGIAGRTIAGQAMPDDRSEFKKGTQAGVQSTEAMLYGLAGLVGESLGNDALRDWGINGYNTHDQAAGDSGPRVQSLAQIHTLGDMFDFASGAMGQMVPFMASTLLGGGVGGLTGRVVAKSAAERLVSNGLEKSVAEAAVKRALEDPTMQAKILSAVKTGAMSGATVSSMGLQQGDTYGQLKQAGIEDAAAPSWVFGAAQGALDVLPEMRVLQKVLAPAGIERALNQSLIRGIAKEAGKQALLEGSTEGAQQALQVAARVYAGGDNFNDKDMQSVIDNAAAGAVVGVLTGGMADVVARSKGKKAADAPAPAKEPTQAAADAVAGATSEPKKAAPPTSDAPVGVSANDHGVVLDVGAPVFDVAQLPNARDEHVLDLMRPTLAATPAGRKTLGDLRRDPNALRAASDKFFAGGIDAETLAQQLSGQDGAPPPTAGPEPAGPTEAKFDYKNADPADTRKWLDSKALTNSEPGEKQAFFAWLNSKDAPAAARIQYEDWRNKQGNAPVIGTSELGAEGKAAPAGLTEHAMTTSAVIGQGGVAEGEKRPGEGARTAKPWQSFARAEAAALEMERTDVDAHYVVQKLDEKQAAKANLAGGEGVYVFSQPKPGAELTFSRADNAHFTEAQLARSFIAKAKAKWDALPVTLKNIKDRKALHYGVAFMAVGKDGKATTVHMDAREITKLGLEASPELRTPQVNSGERLVRAFTRGLSIVVAAEGPGGARYSLPTNQKGQLVGLGRTVLRDGGAAGGAVTLSEARRAYTEASTQGQTMASSGSDSLNAGITDSQQVQGAPGQEGGFAPQQLGVEGRSAESEQRLADQLDAVPAIERGRANTSDQVLRTADTEAAQNRRSTSTVQPGDLFSKQGGDSAIGTQQPSRNPSRVDPHAQRQAVMARLGAKGDAYVNADAYVSRPNNPGLGAQLTKTVATLRAILKLERRIIVVDNLDDYRDVLRANGQNAALESLEKVAAAGGLSTRGFTQRTGDFAVMWVNPDLPLGDYIKTLSHEIGHTFHTQYWNTAQPETRAAVQEAWKAAKNRMEMGMSQSLADASSLRKTTTGGAMEEWLADQMAAWVAAKQVPRSLFEKYLDGLTQKLKDAWTYLTQAYKLEDSFERYVAEVLSDNGDDMDPREMVSIDPSFDSLGIASAPEFDMAAPPADDNAAKRAWAKVTGELKKHPKIDDALEIAHKGSASMGASLFSSLQARIRRMNVPAFNKILGHFNLRPGQTGGHTFYTAVNAKVQTAHTRLNSILERMTPADRQQLMSEMQTERGQYSSPRFAELATQVGAYLKDLRAYQVAAGLPIGDVANYFPQVGDKEELTKADASATIKKALTDAGIQTSDEAITDLIASLTDDAYTVNLDPVITGGVESSLHSPFAQALRTRTMDPKVRDAIRSVKDANGQARFYAKDLHEVLYRYTTQAVRRAEYNRRLGDTGWKSAPPEPDTGKPRPFDPHYKLKELLNDAVSGGAKQDQISFMSDALAAFLGNHGRLKSEAARKMTNALLTYQNIRTLGMILFSSFPDIANVFVRGGDLKSTWDSIRSSYRDAWSAGKEGQTAELLRVFGHGSDTVDALGMHDITDLRNQPGKSLTKINEKWMRVIGMHRWTAFTRALAMRTGVDYIKRHALNVAEGIDTKGDSEARMQELGLTKEDVTTWSKYNEGFYNQAGMTHEDLARGTAPHGITKEEMDSIQKVTGAVSRFINEAVVHAEPPEKTLWGNSEAWKLVWHLKNFMYGFTNRILSRVWHDISKNGATTEGKAQAVLALSMTLPLAAMGMEMKDWLQYGLWGNQDQSPIRQHSAWGYFEAVANRSGALGVVQYGLDIGEAGTKGRAPLVATLGPTLGQMNDFVQYPLYRQLPAAIPVLGSFPGARDALKDKLHGQ